MCTALLAYIKGLLSGTACRIGLRLEVRDVKEAAHCIFSVYKVVIRSPGYAEEHPHTKFLGSGAHVQASTANF